MISKKVPALLMAGVLGFSPVLPALSGFTVLTAFADTRAYTMSEGSYRMMDGTSITGVHARGIDVSHWQQQIDWNQVANDDISFVMLGTRYKGMVDPQFHINAAGAHEAGLKLGAYIYSYATTVEMAEAEADFVLDLVKDYPISYPIAFDVEDSATLGTLSQSELSAVINAFCERIKAAGYYPVVYANDYWLANKIDLSQLPYDVWVARYEVKHVFENPAMWQATSTGSVAGIEGNVDIDFQYKDFSAHIPANQWRTIGDKTYYYQNYTMQKDTWIDDGNGWYYMNQDGQASTGWLEQNDTFYYLAEDSGKMTTGWQNFDNKWYYFGSSGAMSTGWTDADGQKYFMDQDGIMQTGWLKQDGKDYYLKSSGAMGTGWQQIDNMWYYFADSGEMNRGWQNVGGTWYYFNPSGVMQTGWLDENSVKYYLGSDGKMLVNTVFELDGISYSADGSGACIEVTAQENAETGETASDGTAGTSNSDSVTTNPPGGGETESSTNETPTQTSDNPDDYTGPGMEIV